MIILDTNVISELMKPQCDKLVLDWLDQTNDRIAVSTLTVHEIRFGIGKLRDAARRGRLTAQFDRILSGFFSNIALPVGHQEASLGAELRANRHQIDGKDIGFVDAVLAAQATEETAHIATRNLNDFSGLGVLLVDPWDSKTWGNHQ